jgi:hypothetical protein
VARLVETKQILEYRSLRRDLAKIKIFADENFIDSAGKGLQNILFQQKISSKFLNRKYFDAFFLSRYSKIDRFVPVPTNWRKCIEVGLKKQIPKSSVYSWRIFLILMSLKSMKNALLAKKFIIDLNSENDFQIIIDPRDAEIPSGENLVAQYNLVNWLSTNRFSECKFSISDGKRLVNSYFGQIGTVEVRRVNFRAKIFNTTANFKMIFCVLCEVIIYRRWKSLLVLDELIYKKKIESITISTKPIIALFSNSFGPYKPLWTTANKEVQVKAVNYFYSLDLEPPSFNTRMPQDTLLSIATWDEYWVIDEAHRNRVNVVLDSKAQVEVVGFPWMSDFAISSINQGDSLKIALFDIAFKDNFVGWSTYYQLGLAGQEFHSEFVRSILKLAQRYNVQIIHKKKSHSITATKYTKFMTDLQKEFPKHFLSVNANTSPIRLAKVVDGSISQPYTSTGEWCQPYTNSVYFNPKKYEFEVSMNPTKIPELNTFELEKWLTDLISKKTNKRQRG